ncbi:hypothetical protein GYMLUDRAFT_248501 [Collybiopsis luxurians FD-317 M1]|uniref:(2E,6E)-farnesyl diphosphate synthase n=1 Tax=Collybiopsis luxurians FD-317 M1 TaxID=944289 RepID=A0A0D0BLM7_9AGAR|nr:hypothetical protein GYMLUDRAFT_248501 [Collybiopsis luxurians FD-317 M1]
MEFRYSTKLDPSTYDTEGLCDGIDLRKHNFTFLEDRGAIRAQADWTKYVSAVADYRGTLGPEYSFISVIIPECLPDRLEIVAYANEFGVLYDDVIEFLDQEQNDELKQTLLEGAQSSVITTNNSQTMQVGKRKIVSQILLEMLAIDRDCAINLMKTWAKFLELGSSRQQDKTFRTLEEYLPYRMHDVGEMVSHGLLLFALGLKIEENEIGKCHELTRFAFYAMILQNDLYSWEKEYAEAERHEHLHLMNALGILMREHNTDLQGAQQICRELIKKYVAEYMQVIENVKHDGSISVDLCKYVEALQYSISGNLLWSKHCPRYHLEVSFNEAQLEWMHNGVPDTVLSPVASSASSDKPSPTWSLHSESSRSDTPPFEEFPVTLEDLKLNLELPMCTQIIEAPYQYISSLPSKGIRDKFIDALSYWFKVPPDVVEQIKAITNRSHQASLLLDDFQDSSPLRRGNPAAHTIFGAPQTINSAGYCVVKAIAEIITLGNVQIVIDKVLNIYKGQALDLHWTFNGTCPTPAEYLQMIDCKTGAQFELIAQLMLANATISSEANFSPLATSLGRYFQIADDYKNLVSADYTKQKGFCEDLDEGKYSLPLIHLLRSQPENLQISNILSMRRSEGKMMYEHKLLVLKHMKEAKSLEYTHSILVNLHAHIGQQIHKLEEALGETNTELRLLWELLRV